MPDFIDRLGTELEHALTTPLLAEGASGTGPVSGRARRWTRSRRAVLVPVLALLAVAAGAVAIGIRLSAPSVPPRPGAPRATGADALDRRAFAILRRSQLGSDAFPPELHVALSGASGANLALSRRARGIPAGRAWIVPGRGSLCLSVEWPPPGGGGAACAADRTAVSGRLVLTSGIEGRPRGELLAGVAPDGIPRVRVSLADGTTTVASVHENAYLVELAGQARAVTLLPAPAGPPAVRIDLTPIRPPENVPR